MKSIIALLLPVFHLSQIKHMKLPVLIISKLTVKNLIISGLLLAKYKCQIEFHMTHLIHPFSSVPEYELAAA
jgi:hypothetical protein